MGITASTLTLPEKLVLLAYDETGKKLALASNLLNACLEGAVMMELAWGGWFRIEEGSVVAENRPQPENPTLARSFAEVCGRIASPAEWTRISRPFLADLRDSIRKDLVGRGALTKKRKRKMLIFSSARFCPDPSLRQACVAEVLEALDSIQAADIRGLVLAFLAENAHLGYALFPRPALSRYKQAVRNSWGRLAGDKIAASADPAERAQALFLRGIAAMRDSYDNDANGPF